MVFTGLQTMNLAQATLLASSSAVVSLGQVMQNINGRLGSIHSVLEGKVPPGGVGRIQAVVDGHITQIQKFDGQAIRVSGKVEQDIRANLSDWVDGMVRFNESFQLDGDLAKARHDFPIMRKLFDADLLALHEAQATEVIEEVDDADITVLTEDDPDVVIYEEGVDESLHRVMAGGRTHPRASRATVIHPEVIEDVRKYGDQVTAEFLERSYLAPNFSSLPAGTHFVIEVELGLQALKNLGWAVWQRYKSSGLPFDDKAIILRLSSQGQQYRIYWDDTGPTGGFLNTVPEAIPFENS